MFLVNLLLKTAQETVLGFYHPTACFTKLIDNLIYLGKGKLFFLIFCLKKFLIMRLFLVFSIAVFALCACNNKDKNQTGNNEEVSASASQVVGGSTASEPKSYKVSISTDTVVLGKSKELFVKITNAKAIELSDPDGKATGKELSFDLECTNKYQVGGSSVGIYPSEFRLKLDNGNNISPDNANSMNIDPESTITSAGNTFVLPAGSKPVPLNLFYDQTRVPVTVSFQ